MSPRPGPVRPPGPPPPPPLLPALLPGPGRRFCLSMPGRWLEKLRLLKSLALWLRSPRVMAEMPGPPLPPVVPTTLEVSSAAGGASLSPRRSLAKSLLSEAVSHSSLAWSEFWLDRSGDLAVARRGGRGTATVERASSGPGVGAGRAKEESLPSVPLAAFSRSCFSRRKRGGLSCC